MSYFFGTSGANSIIKKSRRKHGRHRSFSNDREIDPGLDQNQHKKCSSKRKSILRLKTLTKNQNVNDTSTKSKSKRCLHKEISRLIEENYLLSAKLEGTEIDLSNLSVVKEKDELLSKLKKKYQQIEQCYYRMQTDHDKKSVLLAQRENDVRQLHMHYEESKLLLRNFEQERNNLISGLQICKNENSQLNEDVSLLKNVIYRLNIEIETYQDKLRLSGHINENASTVTNIIDESGLDLDNKNVLKAWGKVHFHALGPLLDAYQQSINEKDELIQKYKKELDVFTGKVKEIILENQNLHRDIDNLKTKYNKHIDEINSIEQDASSIKEQNDLLTKQLILQKQKIQEIHTVYEQKVESMSQNNNRLHKEYFTCKTELSNIKGKYEILHEGYEKLKNNSEKTMPVAVHNTAIEDCKRYFEELKQQYELEKKKLNSRVKHLEEIQPENEKQIITVTTERDQLKIQVKTLEKNLKKTQGKLERVQNALHSIQVSLNSFKRQLTKTTSYCEQLVKEQEHLITEKNKLTQLLEEKKIENENIQYLGSNITHRMGTLKNQLKMVQEGAKEQLASVEKHLKDQELDADRIKIEYHREMQRLKQLLQQKEEVIHKLRREKCATQDNLELVWKAATKNNKKVKNVLKNSDIYI